MKPSLSIGLIALWITMALGQAVPACNRTLADSEDCADVINPNACYNEYGFRTGTQTLRCVDGKDDADRARKVWLPT